MTFEGYKIAWCNPFNITPREPAKDLNLCSHSINYSFNMVGGAGC